MFTREDNSFNRKISPEPIFVAAGQGFTGIRFARYVLLLAFLLIGLFAWSLAEPGRLQINQTEIKLHNWPAAFDRLKVVALSDIHTGAPHMSERRLEQIVKLVNGLNPDVIVLLGDYVIHNVVGGSFVEPQITAQILGDLKAPHGVVAVLGNHDIWFNEEKVATAFVNEGIRVLENQSLRITRGNESIYLAGFSDYLAGTPDVRTTLEGIPQEASVIGLTHNPDLFPNIPLRVGLTIAGHTHGGQVNLPFIGRPIVPSIYGQRYATGLIEEENHLLFVTSGLGTSIAPVRFRVPPEIAVLTLHPF